MTKDLDRSESLKKLGYNLMRELIEHLDGGPFLGGLSQPSLADFSAYQQVVFGCMVGIEQNLSATSFLEVRDWMNAVKATLPGEFN